MGGQHPGDPVTVRLSFSISKMPLYLHTSAAATTSSPLGGGKEEEEEERVTLPD